MTSTSLPPRTTEIKLLGSCGSDCGYCKGARSSLVQQPPTSCYQSYAILVLSMSPGVYEQFLNRGWRRSGRLLYKPNLFRTCCPQYTLRLPVASFRLSKSQRKLRAKLDRLLRPDVTPKQSTSIPPLPNDLEEKLQQWTRRRLQSLLPPKNNTLATIRYQVGTAKKKRLRASCSVCRELVAKQQQPPGTTAAQLARQVLLEQPPSDDRIASHTIEKGHIVFYLTLTATTTTIQPVDKLGAFLQQASSFLHNGTNQLQQQQGSPTHKWSVRTLPAPQSAALPAVHQLYWDYQAATHGDKHPLNDLLPEAASSSPPSSFHPSWEPVHDTMLQTTYQHLDATRQAHIRHQFNSFWDFLVDSPLQNESTIHQQYWIDDQLLIAVGVLDVLPNGLSSVYLFYHPQFSRDLVTLGTIASLEEIEYTKALRRDYYYLGYYIQSCQKMRYKGEFAPSELLCPKTNRYMALSQARTILLRDSPQHHAAAFYASDEEEETNHRHHNNNNVFDTIALNVGVGHSVTLRSLTDEVQQLVQHHLQDFVKQAGLELAQQCTIKLVG